MHDYKIKFGVGSSAFQQGAFGEFGDSNWTLDAIEGNVPKTTITHSYWDTIYDHLTIMENMGIKTYRISIERSFIEPKLGKYDLEALNKYELLIDTCRAKNINVMLTLHHFTHPGYVVDGFKNQENIQPFVEYCQHVFARFSSKVNLWCTLNEPGVEAFSGYLLGQFPPHHHLQTEEAACVLRNTMQAHMDVYHALKNMDNGQHVSIGLVHNILRFKSLYVYDYLSSTIAHKATAYTNDLIMDFLRTGEFINNDYPQFNYIDKRVKGDYFGLNFYANPTIGPNLTNVYGATCQSNQTMGDMYLPIDPEGFVDALDEATQLDLPIYITETGIADEKDTLRPLFLIQYLRVIVGALAEGRDIREFIVWTFQDNYEWNEGNKKSFGLFDAEGKPRASAHLYERLMKHMQLILNNQTLSNKEVITRLHELLNSAEQFIKQKHSKTYLEAQTIGSYQPSSDSNISMP